MEKRERALFRTIAEHVGAKALREATTTLAAVRTVMEKGT
jgi:hypothetical protein